MAEKMCIVFPYSEVTWGKVYLDCIIDDGVTKEEFLAGVKDGSIDPFAFAWEGEHWSESGTDHTETLVNEAEEIK